MEMLKIHIPSRVVGQSLVFASQLVMLSYYSCCYCDCFLSKAVKPIEAKRTFSVPKKETSFVQKTIYLNYFGKVKTKAIFKKWPTTLEVLTNAKTEKINPKPQQMSFRIDVSNLQDISQRRVENRISGQGKAMVDSLDNYRCSSKWMSNIMTI